MKLYSDIYKKYKRYIKLRNILGTKNNFNTDVKFEKVENFLNDIKKRGRYENEERSPYVLDDIYHYKVDINNLFYIIVNKNTDEIKSYRWNTNDYFQNKIHEILDMGGIPDDAYEFCLDFLSDELGLSDDVKICNYYNAIKDKWDK